MSKPWKLLVFAAAGAAAAAAPVFGGPIAGHAGGGHPQLPFCGKLGHSIQASSGAQMYCFGPQQNGPGTVSSPFGGNVDAASTAEDVAPNGTRGYGQSEESVAASGSYVVEAWNDSTGFFSARCSPMNKDQLTGFGFSSNNGKSFTDLGGLPNSSCASSVYSGDPSVETYRKSGTNYFYISSLYETVTTTMTSTTFGSDIAMDVCHVVSGSLSCSSTPVIIATGVPLICTPTSCTGSMDFLDKDFMSIDASHGRLDVSYDRFTGSGASQVELAVCDLSSPGSPTCYPGSSTAPYLVVYSSAADPNNCEQEGAYPSVDRATGAVYVAWEGNWPSEIGCPTPATNDVAYIPASCLTLTPTSPCTSPAAMVKVPITSMSAAFIPGYNRFPMNDFPRIAVSDPHSTVSIVWNDARYHPAGDILLQSWHLATLTPIQSKPTIVNGSQGGWHMLPALRGVDDDGDLEISFYQRSSGTSSLTSYVAALNVSPLATSTTAGTTVTSASTNWSNTSSDIIPNFGDYTDNYVTIGLGTDTDEINIYAAWADGRSGDPQPFFALAHTDGS
jgi:hypothetical protein